MNLRFIAPSHLCCQKNMLPISCMLKNCHYCGFALLPACHHCNSWPHPAHELCVCVCEPPISPSSAAFILLQQCYIPAISTSAPWQNFLRGSLGFMACGCWLQIAIDMLQAAVSTALRLHYQPLGRALRYFWNGRHTLLLFTFRHIHPRLFDNVLPLGKPDNCD